MKTILFTGWDEPYAELAKITVPLMINYARRHGIGIHTFEVPPPGLNIYWTGVARGLQLLNEGVDRVFYLDVDQLITNHERPPSCDPDCGLWVSKDWGSDAVESWQFSACGWIAHRDCIKMFEEVIAMEPEWRDKPFQEQGPWQEWVKQNMGKPSWAAPFINLWPRRMFNAVPDAVCPGNVPEPWQPGDFAAHLTMVPIERRIEIAHELKDQLNEQPSIHTR